ncbi:regulating synaptic membrane exocytosis protein 2, partial [Clonorchis sinensis]
MTAQPRPRGYSFTEHRAPQTTTAKRPTSVASETPDLSHLTLEERRIIEEVMYRQQEVESRNAELIRKTESASKPKPDALLAPTSVSGVSTGGVATGPDSNINGTDRPLTGVPLKNTVSNMVSGALNVVSGNTLGTGGIMDATCGVCRKTKFADGLGHVCMHCKRKICTRCGYQINTGVHQVQWTCKPCADQPSSQQQQSNLGNSSNNNGPFKDDKAAGRLIGGIVGLITGQGQQQT